MRADSAGTGLAPVAYGVIEPIGRIGEIDRRNPGFARRQQNVVDTSHSKQERETLSGPRALDFRRRLSAPTASVYVDLNWKVGLHSKMHLDAVDAEGPGYRGIFAGVAMVEQPQLAPLDAQVCLQDRRRSGNALTQKSRSAVFHVKHPSQCATSPVSASDAQELTHRMPASGRDFVPRFSRPLRTSCKVF